MTDATTGRKPRRGAVWIVLIMLLATLARGLFPLADPPLQLSGSGGIFSDEGTYTTNARNLLLFGKAFTDEWNSYQYSPVLHILQLPVFALLGVGLLQERLIPLAFGIATVWLLFLVTARAWGREAGGYAAFFLATSYFTIMHNRLGLVETSQTFIMVLALFLWQKARENRRGFGAAAGIAVALVVITKSLALWFVAAFYAAAACEVLLAPAAERRPALKRLLQALLASAATMGLWYVLFYLPNREDLLRFGAAYKKLSIPGSTAQVLRNLKKVPFFGYYRPEWALLSVALLAVSGLLLRLRRQEILERLEVWRMTLWLVAGVIALDVLNYAPTRYFVPLAPALAALAGWGLASFRRPAPEGAGTSPTPLGLLAAWAWLTVVLRFLLVEALSRHWSLGPFSRQRLHWVLSAGIAAALIALLPLARRLFARLQAHRGLRLRTAAVAFVLLVSLTLNARMYAVWAGARRYTVLETSRELAPIVDGGLVAGLFAPVLALENRARVLYAMEPWCNFERTFERFPITHFVLADFNREPSWWWHRYPEQMRRAIPLKVYRIWQTNVFLLSLREQDRGFSNRMRTDRGGPRDSTALASTDLRELLVGATGEGQITFRNSGSVPWTDGVALGVWSGRPLGPGRIPLPPGTLVRPGESLTIVVPYQAPATTGYFMKEWRLVDESGAWFGDSIPEGMLVHGPHGEI